ncbi:hypothetical protein EV363DRAFT_75075 [Boletus edulis]|nr:hypothetical protein EV363DRAFT_75075 [Boletus edulis]
MVNKNGMTYFLSRWSRIRKPRFSNLTTRSWPQKLPPSQPLHYPILRNHLCPLLVQHCPACFGGTAFGRPLAEGGDIHVATHGNFRHCHHRSAGDSSAFYNPMARGRCRAN